jgi:endonuclease/exonuclease/phosphatase family metal-dependent hydrolase
MNFIVGMQMQTTITTFNVENLFNRFEFLNQPWDQKNDNWLDMAGWGNGSGQLRPYEISVIQRNNTAQAILDAAPDILAVQEIEDLHTLRNFNASFLDDYFDQMIAIEGNDRRGIDVGLLIRKGFAADILNLRTHADEAANGGRVRRYLSYIVPEPIFSRDCLEVEMQINGRTLTFLINHFKAQDKRTPNANVAKRRRQAERVAQIALAVEQSGKFPIVLGDLNVDPRHPVIPGDDSLASLLALESLQDPFPAETWTHYYVPAKSVSRLDYVLPHRDLKVVETKIVRHGLTAKCKQYPGPRYPTIGAELTEASDHCPASVVLDI